MSFGADRELELAENACNVSLEGVLADAEVGRDREVGPSLGHSGEHVQLALAQFVEWPAPAPAVETPAAAPSDQRTEAETAPAVAKPVAYKVTPGQSLWSIAADELGNGSRYIEILNLNPQLQGDPGRLVPGQELTLPPAGTE